jgi:hypothetical protein
VTDELVELIPYSMRKRRPDLELKLPHERTADEDINAIVDESIRRDAAHHPVNLGFARFKGRRT